MVEGFFTWRGTHPDFASRKWLRCRLGLRGDDFVIRSHGFMLAVPLDTLTWLQYTPRLMRSTLQVRAKGGIDITLRESPSSHVNGEVINWLREGEKRSSQG